MSETTAVPAGRVPTDRPESTPVTDHGIVIGEHHSPIGEFRSSCLCGWISAWVGTRAAAREAGMAHLALTTVTLPKLVDEILTRPELLHEIAGFNTEQLAEVKCAMLAAAAEAVHVAVNRRGEVVR